MISKQWQLNVVIISTSRNSINVAIVVLYISIKNYNVICYKYRQIILTFFYEQTIN